MDIIEERPINISEIEEMLSMMSAPSTAPIAMPTTQVESVDEEEQEEEQVEEPQEEQTITYNDIPTNPESILIDESVSRFSAASWFEYVRNVNVTLAGLGGIGSHVAFFLSRIKPYRLYMYDADTVELANLSGQMYSNEDVGKTKVFAISEIVRRMSGYYGSFAYNRRFTGHEGYIDPIAICGFDNMDSRKSFYYAWKSKHMDKEEALFIDGRLAAEEFQIFCIQGTHKYSMEVYERDWLFSDKEAEETICSYKQTTYCSAMIGAYIVNLFVNFISNIAGTNVERDVPFKTVYNASTMMLITE